MSPPDRAPRGHPPWTGRRPTASASWLDAPAPTIPGRLREVATARAGATAIVAPSGSLTYEELWDEVQRTAATIEARLGVGTDPVAVLMAHDGPQVVSLLGVLTTGRPVVILDPTAPPALTRALLDAANTPLVIVDDTTVDAAGELTDPERLLRTADIVDGRPIEPPVDGSLPALLAYTSGTSGEPKAAVVPHRQLLHLVESATEVLAITEVDRLPMLFPLSLAVAAYPMFIPLLNGGTLCVLDLRGEGLAVVPEWLAEQRISVAYLAPTVVRFLEDAVGDTIFPDLRLVVLGGERVDRSDLALTRRLFGNHVVVANGYGTTETGVLTFWFDTDDDGQGDDHMLPVGYPIAGMDLIIRRPDGRVAPRGEAGELTVRSPYLFCGYWGRPDLDAQVLTEDSETGLPVYRTGDIGRITASGWLELAGRVDSQVKVDGHRVVLGEVEEAILALDQVKDAAVVPAFERAGAAQLLAYIVPVPEQGVTIEMIRAALAEDVPAFMIPSSILFRDELPQLPNGKLDRQALEKPTGDRPTLGTEYAPPGDELEEAIVGVWEDLLGLRPLGTGDDFFDLGGSSLLAAQMLVRIETELGTRLPMAVLLEAKTPAALAAAVRNASRTTHRPSSVVCIQEGDTKRPRLYLAHDLHGSAFRFRHLAAALGTDQPVFGFESPFLSGEPPAFTRIDTLALRYVTDLRRHQSQGPYHLAGYSFGGVLAFEMARILRREGDDVGVLVIIDVGPGYRGVGYSRHHPPPYPTFDHPGLLHRLGIDQQVLPWRWRRDLRRRGAVRPEDRLWWAWQKHWELVGPDWDASPYDGPIHLFWAQDTGSTDASQGWDAKVERVDIVRLPVDHERIMDVEEVHHLAEPLRVLLDQVS